MEQNYIPLARKILGKTLYHDSTELIYKLARQLKELNDYGLTDQISVLLNNTKTSSRNFLSFVAENNFAVDLARFNLPNALVEYEPERYNKTDFVLQRDGVSFFLQMKRLANNERENRRSKDIDKIKEMFVDIPIGKFCSIKFVEDFNDSDIYEFVELSKITILLGQDNKSFYFPNQTNTKAVIKFFPPNLNLLSHLTVGVTGDLNMVNVSNEDTKQIVNCMKRASGVFTWNNSDTTVNLIAMEADHFGNIDISEAVFGSEVFIVSTDGVKLWDRQPNGYFYSNEYSEKICGVVALRRQEDSIISSYHKTLFINDRFSHQVEFVKKIMCIDEVLTLRDLPEN